MALPRATPVHHSTRNCHAQKTNAQREVSMPQHPGARGGCTYTEQDECDHDVAEQLRMSTSKCQSRSALLQRGGGGKGGGGTYEAVPAGRIGEQPELVHHRGLVHAHQARSRRRTIGQQPNRQSNMCPCPTLNHTIDQSLCPLSPAKGVETYNRLRRAQRRGTSGSSLAPRRCCP